MLCASILQRMDSKIGEDSGEQDDRRLSLSTNELISLSEEITKLLQTKEQNDQYEGVIADLEHQIDVLTNRFNTCKERNQGELEYLTLALENRSEELQQAQDSSENKETTLKQMKRTVQKQETEIDQKDSLIHRHEQEIAELKDELARQNKRLKTLRGEKEKHTKALIVEVEEKANRVVSFNNDVKIKTFEVEDPTEALEKELYRTQRENKKLKDQLAELAWQMKAKDIMISNGEDTMQALENQFTEIEDLQERIGELEGKLSSRDASPGDESPPAISDAEMGEMKMKIKQLELTLKNREETTRNTESKLNEELLELRRRAAEEEDRIQAREDIVLEVAPVEQPVNSREEEYLGMLIKLRDSFYHEFQLQPSPEFTNGKGRFETVFEDLQTVLGSIRLKVKTVLEESVKESTKEMERLNSLKKMNTSLKEEIQSKTENYSTTVSSLQIKNEALNKSITIKQQLNDELTEKITEAEENSTTMVDKVQDLMLKMMIRDSEVERLKGILENLKKSKKMKKLNKKDKKKSTSLSNLLRS